MLESGARASGSKVSRGFHRDPSPAGVAELVDAPDLGSGDESRGGSTPSARTNTALLRKIIGKVATAGDL